MHTILICVAAAAVGIDVGWQRLPDEGMEYIIQLDPDQLSSLRAGQTIQSDIPPAAGEIRTFRILVGKKELPHETPLAPRVAKEEPSAGKESQPPLPIAMLQHPDGTQQVGAANYVEQQKPAVPTVPKEPEPTAEHESTAEMPDRPWLPLTFTLIGLIASLGANVYLGWIAVDARLARKRLLERATATGSC